MKLDVLTIGGVVRDVLFYSAQGELIKNKKNLLKQELLAFEFGAKIYSDDVFFAVGGGAANTAVNFAKLGMKVGIISQIGSDFNGNAITEELKNEKINLDNLKIDPQEKTGFSFVVVDKNSGEHTVFAYRGAADNLQIKPKDFQVNQADWLYLASLSGKFWRQSLDNIFANHSKIAWNPGSAQLTAGYRALKSYIAKTTIFNVNKDEALELVLSKDKNFKDKNSLKNLLIEIKNWGPKIVVITNSKKGSVAYDGRQFYSQLTLKNKPVDTTGAGDCFGSSFVTGYLKFSGDIQKAMRLATVNASSLVSKVGAQNGLLTFAQALKALKKLK